MGWSNVGAVAINATSVTLFDNAGNVVGTLDGINGLVFYGNGGSAGNPGTRIIPDGEINWSGLTTGLPISEHASIDALSTTDDAGKKRFGILLTSGALSPSNVDAVVGIMSAPADNSEPAAVFTNAPMVATDPSNVQFAPEIWHAPSPGTNWALGTAGGTNYQPAQYRVDSQGNLIIVGAMHPTSAAPAATLFTLPAAYTPKKNQRVVGTRWDGANATCIYIEVNSSGVVSLSSNPGNGQDVYFQVCVPLGNIP